MAEGNGRWSTHDTSVSVNQRLKERIQWRRMTQGLDPYIHTHTNTPKQYELTESDKKRVAMRQAKNRMSAMKYRYKRQASIEELQERVKCLQNTNYALLNEERMLRSERDKFRSILTNHIALCHSELDSVSNVAVWTHHSTQDSVPHVAVCHSEPDSVSHVAVCHSAPDSVSIQMN